MTIRTWFAAGVGQNFVFNPDKQLVKFHRGLGPGVPENYLLDARFDLNTDPLVLNDGDQLHDDYPANGVGKIRKGWTLTRDATGDTAIISAGTYVQQTGVDSSAKLISGGVYDPIVAGLTSLFGITLNSNAGYQALTHRRTASTSGNNRIIELYRLAGGTTWSMRVRNGSSVIETFVDLASANVGQYYKVQITLGGYGDTGLPDPLGDKGGLVFVNDRLLISTIAPHLAIQAAALSVDQNSGNGLNSMQTRIDTGALKTPARSLFSTDHADIADYTPDDGPGWVVPVGAVSTSGGLATVSGSQGRALIDPGSPAAYMEWDYTQNILGVGWFRHEDSSPASGMPDDAYRVQYNASNMAFYEHVGGVETGRGSSAATTTRISRYILADDGSTMTAIHAAEGVVLSYQSTAGAARTKCGIGTWTAAVTYNWFCVRATR